MPNGSEKALVLSTARMNHQWTSWRVYRKDEVRIYELTSIVQKS
jgi:hypothetical protein